MGGLRLNMLELAKPLEPMTEEHKTSYIHRLVVALPKPEV